MRWSRLLIVGLTLVARLHVARAQPAPPEAPGVTVDGKPLPAAPPPAAPPPVAAPPLALEPAASEVGLGALQILVGTVGMVAAFIPVGILIAASPPAGGIGVLVTPTAGGFIVCGLGNTSRFYEHGCAPSVLGAYIGAVTAIPLTFLGCSFGEPHWGSEGCDNGAAIGLITGLFLGTAAGATLAWQLTKTRRPPVRWSRPGWPTPALANPLPEGRRPSPPMPGRDGRILIPILAFEF